LVAVALVAAVLAAAVAVLVVVAHREVGEMALLTEEESRQIGQAVARAEAKTSGELAVLIAERCDDYALFRGGFAVLGALAWSDVLGWFFPDLQLTLLLLGALVLTVVLYLVSQWGPLLRLLVPAQIRAERVQERALRAMIEHGIVDTAQRSGVLMLLSEREHRVVLLADRGINARVAPEEWEQDVQTLLVALRQGNTTSGLLQVIERVGALLAEHFPRQVDDQNELPDAPRLI
jgi:putative membrane protein